MVIHKLLLNKDLAHIIRLIRTQNIGPITFFKLLEKYKTPLNAINNLSTFLKKSNPSIKIYSEELAQREIELALKQNIHIVSYLDEFYPPLLKNIDDKPPILFVKGNLNLLKKSAIAIVGSRNCTINGKNLANNFAQNLGKNGFLVVSGLARGIDTSAHIGALEKGTIAFLGGGVDIIYPLENKKLYEDISNKGALVSEFPIGSSPIASNFPKRNRLISGMSRGVLLIEASLTSGSMITAQTAINQGREVFAVPGSPLDKNSSGTNELIKQGAVLTQSIDDILNNLNNYIIKEESSNPYKPHLEIKDVDETSISKAKEYLLNVLSTTPIALEILIQESNFDYNVLNNAILELELLGKAIRLSNGYISLIGSI